MIIFNECRIDDEGKHLIIDASVDTLDYYKDVYIKAVSIDTQETFSINGPINEPIAEFKIDYTKAIGEDCCQYIETDSDDCDCVCGNVYTGNKAGNKHIRLYLTADDLNIGSLNDDIFFVYVHAGGVPEISIPCCMDNSYTMSIAVNLRPIYNLGMNYIRELGDRCTIPRGFIDYILRLKAFKLALKTGNYPVAIEYWNTLFKNKPFSSIGINKKCGCNGY